VVDIPWAKHQKKARTLYTPADVQRLIDAAQGTKKNAVQFADYIRFLQYSGAREQEALRVRWDDVNFDQKQVAVGAEGDYKNAEFRHVDFSPALESHLRDMLTRRAPDSQWLFPSPQRGEKDIHARKLRESLKLCRTKAGMPSFGFHDLRHHFASYAVMSGIDFMTIAKWLGHKDGGILVGRTYGHLANEHRQAQAAKLVFAPTMKTQEITA
jgi:integrase